MKIRFDNHMRLMLFFVGYFVLRGIDSYLYSILQNDTVNSFHTVLFWSRVALFLTLFAWLVYICFESKQNKYNLRNVQIYLAVLVVALFTAIILYFLARPALYLNKPALAVAVLCWMVVIAMLACLIFRTKIHGG